MKQGVILSVQNLKKHFGLFQAVNGVSFDVKKGEIVGLLGPNGAGKTTTIQMLLGLMTPSSGSIHYFNLPLEQHRSDIMKRVNTMSGYSKLPWKLSVWENLHVYSHLYEVDNPKKRIHELAERFSMIDLLPKKFLDLSAGQMTRVLLVKSLLNNPELLLLDEPTASLDPDIADIIRKYLLDERQNRDLSILITSHNMAEVEEMCDRVIFLNKGTIYAIDTPKKLAQRNKECIVKLMITDGLKRTVVYLQNEKLPYTETKRFVTIRLEENHIAPFLTALAKQKIEYKDIEILRPSLEDFFLKMAGV